MGYWVFPTITLVMDFSFFSFFIFIYLAIPGLRCSRQALLVLAFKLLVAQVGSSSLTRNRTRGPDIGSAESQPLDFSYLHLQLVELRAIPSTELCLGKTASEKGE